jgi:hypothetical protein
VLVTGILSEAPSKRVVEAAEIPIHILYFRQKNLKRRLRNWFLQFPDVVFNATVTPPLP